MKNIPRVDLNDFLSEDLDRKNRFVAELGHAFEHIGFVILRGHYLTKEQTEILYAQIKQFFALPTADKAMKSPTWQGNAATLLLGKKVPKEKPKET